MIKVLAYHMASSDKPHVEREVLFVTAGCGYESMMPTRPLFMPWGLVLPLCSKGFAVQQAFSHTTLTLVEGG